MSGRIRVWWLSAPPVAQPLVPRGGGAETALFERPERGERVVGIGVAAEVALPAPRTLADAARAIGGLHRRVEVRGDAAAHGGAVLLGGGAFDPERPGGSPWGSLPAARWVLPRALFLWRGGSGRCAIAGAASWAEARSLRDAALASLCAPHPASPDPGRLEVEPDEPPAAYRARVAAAVEGIARGELGKVVLARTCRVRAEGPIDAGRLLLSLRRSEPESALFALRVGEGWFVGATPERLLRVEGGRVEAHAVAGSVARGRSPEEDLARRARLRESKKDQEEHAWVRETIRAALAPRVVGWSAPEAAGVVSTGGLHHLHTPFRGARRPGTGVLDLAAALHPTPAVAGSPRAASLGWLREREPLARGWYAGPVGWVGLDGEGDLGVALRCALVRGREATLFAGAGIVAGSQPEAELEETRLKLRAVLVPLLEV